MTNELKLEVTNLKLVNQYLKNLPEDTFKDAKLVFSKAVLAADRRVKLLFGRRLISRTGMLRRSIRTSVTGVNLKNLRASLYSAASVAGTPVVYAPIQELGGTVEAINKYVGVPGGPYLNIPTGSNKTAAGVMRKTAKMVFEEGGYIQKTRADNWGVFLGSKMMFVLKKKVHIPPRLSMTVSMERQVPTILSSLSSMIGED